MHLKHLDIVGFKSFPDRTRLTFGTGMTAVVGPNGSGKSNIADALRWVMGETSAKTLRGGKMEDVIFSGTAHRRPLGYAEIVMQLNNADRKLPMDFDEISVARRVYRSGDSEYLLNGSTCRLKDIQLLFMDTGVGRDGYSIIGQGRIDEILSARSEDRRLLFEEAAGIGKFKTRRNEALTKMEREQQNLARVTDIITELDKQIEPLSVQAEEAKLYLSLKEQYKTIHINIFLEESVRLKSEMEKNNALLEELTTQYQGGHRLLSEARMAGEALKASAIAADAAYKRAGEQLLDAATALEKKESHIRLLQSDQKNKSENRSRFNEEISKREAAIEEKINQTHQTEKEKIETEQTLLQLKTSYDERQEAHSALDQAMRVQEEALSGHNQNIMEQMALATEAKTKLRETELAYERLEDDKERLNSEILHHETLLEEEEAREKECRFDLTTHEAETHKIKTQLEAYREAQNQLKISCLQITNEHVKHQGEFQTLSSRYKALLQLETHHEGYYRSVKAVLRAKQQNPQYAGICGAVGELVSVPARYEQAIETALGGSAQHIVVETESDAKRAIEMLKATREGRATFLPLTAVKGRTISKNNCQNEPGFIGIASELISHDPEYNEVMAQLLGNVVVMSSIDHALAYHKKNRYTQKIVTLEGELLSPGGAITGGSTQRNVSGILGRGRQLKELVDQIGSLQKTVDKLSAERSAEENKLQSTEEALNRAAERIQSLLIEQNNLQNALNGSTEKLNALQNTLVACQQENENLMSRLVETNGLVKAAFEDYENKEADVEKAREQLEAYRIQMADERTLQSEQMQELSDLRVEIGRQTEVLNQTMETIKRLEKEQNVLVAEKEAWLQEIAKSEKAEQDIQTQIETNLYELEEGKERLAAQRIALTAMEKEQADLNEAMSQAESDERTQADETTRLESAIARLEVRREQYETDSRRIFEEIWEEYGLTYQQALPYKSAESNPGELRKESQRLKAELNKLTDVNVGAIEMYKQVKTRYDFLTAQKDDILKAEADLRGLVDTLTRQMEEQFSNQFEIIAGHFNDVFKEMFNGGQAGLRLLNKESVLESGIEITAQPPGKALQTLLLLSGGERALTAIALLFAILRLKPSPFCVLDEIEAALDDANVARFAKFLKQYTDGTQFIIITHRKGTMEAADTLYGVTMQEQGVSKLVSVRFVEEMG